MFIAYIGDTGHFKSEPQTDKTPNGCERHLNRGGVQKGLRGYLLCLNVWSGLGLMFRAPRPVPALWVAQATNGNHGSRK